MTKQEWKNFHSNNRLIRKLYPDVWTKSHAAAAQFGPDWYGNYGNYKWECREAWEAWIEILIPF